jgi:hypothetical protein
MSGDNKKKTAKIAIAIMVIGGVAAGIYVWKRKHATAPAPAPTTGGTVVTPPPVTNGATCPNPEQYYLDNNPDVKASADWSWRPFEHWTYFGWRENRLSCWPAPQQ